MSPVRIRSAAPSIRREGEEVTLQKSADPRLTIFAVTWALTALFHLWSAPHATSLLASTTALSVAYVAVAAAAGATLAGPSRPWRLLALAVAEVWSVYLEAPVLG